MLLAHKKIKFERILLSALFNFLLILDFLFLNNRIPKNNLMKLFEFVLDTRQRQI